MDNNGFDAEIDAPSVGVGNFFESLPDGYLANALALTSPRDVGRLSMVCSVFRSAAEWDVVWERFLPPDYQQILAEAEGGAGGLITSASTKELYLSLCDHPVIIDGGKKSFWLDKLTGKKCYMLAARELLIIWGDTPAYWRWIPLAESRLYTCIDFTTFFLRFDFLFGQFNMIKITDLNVLNTRFAEVAELLTVCWFEVRGGIDSSMLSTDTCYVAYLVYKSTPRSYGFDDQHVEVSFGLSSVESQMKTVFLDPGVSDRPRDDLGQRRRRLRVGRQSNAALPLNGPKRRQDGWLEIELGEFFNEMGLDGDLHISVLEVKGLNWKGGLIIQGIEIRPKATML